MPQMFPLLWLFLFVLANSSIIIMVACVNFTEKPSALYTEKTSIVEEKFFTNWKW